MSTKSAGEGKLIPDRLVAERYAVSTRTLARWDAISPVSNFPSRFTSVVAATARSGSSTRGSAPTARKAVAAHNPHRDVAQALPRARAGRFTKPRDIEAR